MALDIEKEKRTQAEFDRALRRPDRQFQRIIPPYYSVTMKKASRVPDEHRHQWFYDLETRNWDEPLCAVAIRDDGETERFVGPDSAAKMAALQQQARGVWWAHAGGIFDHLLCWRHGPLPAEVIMTGSSVLKARALPKKGSGQLLFRDSYPRWLASLDKVGKAVGLAKLDVGDRGALDKLDPAALVTYCERDVQVLRKGTETEDAWLDQWGCKAATSGTAAVKLLEALDPSTWAQLARPDCMVSTDVACGADDEIPDHGDPARVGALAGVRGGRVECRHLGPVDGPIHVYDLHSSYPSQYGKGPLWAGCIPTDSTDLGQPGWLDLCTWDQRMMWTSGQRTAVPWTAFELGQGGEGAGTVTAWLTWEVADELRRRGMVPQRHGVGYQGVRQIEGFGERFVKELFRAKEGGGAEAFFAKVTVNSLHGKFGENPNRFRHTLRKPFWGQSAGGDREFLDYYSEVSAPIRIQPYHQPLVAATLLARARLTLAKGIEALEQNGWRFYYCDTDSLHTNCPPAEAAKILDVGPELGQWGWEFVAERGFYLAPKVYYLVDAAGKTKKAAKGFPRDLTWASFEQAWKDGGHAVARKGLAKAKQGGRMGTASTLTRTLRPVYHGRLLRSDGRLDYK